jgi:hypothetical protein
VKDAALGSLVQALALSDPGAAFAWVDKIQGHGTKLASQTAVMGAWFKTDPDAAINYLVASKNPQLESGLATPLSQAMTEMTAQEQARVLEKLPAGKMKTEVLSAVVRSASRAGRYQDAVRLLNDVPDSMDRDCDLQDLAYKWSSSDRKTVQDWLKQLPDSTDRDLLTAGYAAALAITDAQAALQVLPSIPDENVRRTAARNVYARWYAKEPAAAEAWLNASYPNARDRDLMSQTAHAPAWSLFPPFVVERR